ncbi:MAG TPA: hypothetical protein VJ810_13595 [Blastocatellia bacterium]|nr:hypothetical protein [Blastocatellia bacterium]
MSKQLTIQKAGEYASQQATGAAPAPARPGLTAADVRSMLEAQLRNAYEEALKTPSTEVAEPSGAFGWDVFGFGPIQLGATAFPFPGAPFLPHQIIRVGESALVATVLVGGPLFTATVAQFLPPVEYTYTTGQLNTWTIGPANLQNVSNSNLSGNPFDVDIFSFTPTIPGLYEMNINVRIKDSLGGNTPPFSGFASRIQKFDPGIFLPSPTVLFDTGIKFQVYA